MKGYRSYYDGCIDILFWWVDRWMSWLMDGWIDNLINCINELDIFTISPAHNLCIFDCTSCNCLVTGIQLDPSISSYISSHNSDLVIYPEDELYIYLEGIMMIVMMMMIIIMMMLVKMMMMMMIAMMMMMIV